VGIYPCVANTIVWAANNSEGVYKRGVTLGFVIGWGNLNGIVSSNIYRAKDKPNFRLGHAVVLAYMVLFLFGGSLFAHFMLVAENKKRLAGKRDNLIAGKSQQEIEMLGDMRYDMNGLSRALYLLTLDLGLISYTLFEAAVDTRHRWPTRPADAVPSS
jgi:hypothetical protein